MISKLCQLFLEAIPNGSAKFIKVKHMVSFGAVSATNPQISIQFLPFIHKKFLKLILLNICLKKLILY